MNSTLRSFQVAAMTGLLLTASGCGSMYIHNETREKQGVEAKDAWSKVDTDAVIAAERNNLVQLLKTELETQDKLALAIRDHHLRELVDSKSITDSLFENVDKQLKILVGPTGSAAVDTALDAQSDRRTWTKLFVAAQESWSQSSTLKPPPQCSDLGDDDTEENKARRLAINAEVMLLQADTVSTRNRKLGAKAVLDVIEIKCQSEPNADPFIHMDGAMGIAHKRLVKDLEQAVAAKASLSSQAAEYKAAAKAYTEALSSSDADSSKKAAEALNRLNAAIKALESAPDALSRQFISKERLNSLNNFVSAVSQASANGKLPEGADKATVAFVLFPKLVDDAKKSLSDAEAPLALPLLIQRNQEQLKLEAVTREVAARETMLRISEAALDTTFEQARQLAAAKKALNEVADLTEVKGKPTAEAFKNTLPKQRESLYRAAALYLDALNRLEARRYKLEYQYIAAHHELQLAYAEVNAKQWSALIGSTVEQVTAASAGGIKSDSVVALLSMLGIFYIGNGVN